MSVMTSEQAFTDYNSHEDLRSGLGYSDKPSIFNPLICGGSGKEKCMDRDGCVMCCEGNLWIERGK